MALLLIALGVGTFLVTREPSRELDAQGRTWVADFSTWHTEISRPLGRAVATTGGLRGEGLSAQQVKLLSACTQSLEQLGSQPGILDAVAKEANAACGEIEFALSVDAKYGSSRTRHDVGPPPPSRELARRRSDQPSGGRKVGFRFLMRRETYWDWWLERFSADRVRGDGARDLRLATSELFPCAECEPRKRRRVRSLP